MAVVAKDFEGRISSLDLSLFESVPSQTSPNDRRSLLSIQLATRSLTDGYSYLEIGSYLGGSIQPHLLDPACHRIYSIDKRPARQPDNRGLSARYKHNSTERMLDLLSALDRDAVQKVRCFDSDSKDIDPADVEAAVSICLIDGEHTDVAVQRDFEFCREVIDGEGVIVFHDAPVVCNGLIEVVRTLEREGSEFHAYNLPDGLMVFELGGFAVHEQQPIAERLLDNHVGYLASIQSLDHLLRWANLPPLRLAREIRLRLRGGRYCE